MRRMLCGATAAILAALALSACGEKVDRIQPVSSAAESLTLELDAAPNVDHAPIYAALADGDFQRAGLNVHLVTPSASDPGQPLAQVESGAVQVGIITEPQLMLARSQGATVLAFGAIVQRPQTAIVALGARHIHTVADLRGRTIAISGAPDARALVQGILAQAHVATGSVQIADVGDDLAGALTSGRAAAAFGRFTTAQLARLRRHRVRPTVISSTSAGVPTYDDLVLVCTEVEFAKHDNELRRLVQAIGRGYAAVRSNPAVGAQALNGGDPAPSATVDTAAVRAALPSFAPPAGQPFGWQTQTQWNTLGRWMVNHDLIDGPRAWYDDSTNQLLAGQGP